MKRSVLFAAALACTLGKPLHAEPADGFAFQPYGSYNTYALTDWNSYTSILGVSSGSASASAGGLYNGFSYGALFRYAFPGGLELALDGEYLTGGASTWVNFGSNMQTLKYQLNALFTGAQARYTFADLESAWFSFGAGAGILTLSGAGSSTEATSNYYFSGSGSPAYSTDYTGSGYGAKLFINADWLTGDAFSLSAQLGYRIAVVPEFNDKNGKFLKSNGSPMPLDYSGLILSVGLAWWP